MIDIEKAKLNPGQVFATPKDVLSAKGLSKDQKIDILRRWGYDAKVLAVAEEENMPASVTNDGNTIFDEVIEALHELGVGLAPEE